MHDLSDNSALQARAEQRLSNDAEVIEPLTHEETLRLLHELRVHQIELDMQNRELRQAEEELSAVRDRYRDLYDFAPVGYLSLSLDGHIILTNFTSATLLGVARHDLMQQPFAHFIARHGQEQYHFLRQQLQAEQTTQIAELPMMKANGTVFWARLNAIPAEETVLTGTPVIPTYRITITDISDRKQMEDINEQQRAELTATMSSLADGLVVCSPHGEIMRINESARKLLAYPTEVLEVPFLTHLHSLLVAADGGGQTTEEMPTARALRGETVTGAVMVLKLPDRIMWLLVSAAPLRMHDGQLLGAVTTFSDITPLHNLQEQQLLLHLVSHDLRTPLAIIAGYASIIAENATVIEGDELIIASMQAIQRGVARMTTMIDELTEMARVEGEQLQLHCEPVGLVAFLKEFVHRSAKVFDMTRLHLDIAVEETIIEADGPRLDRIISNLISNAMKYSAADAPVSLRVASEDDYAIFSVTDQGCGIPSHELTEIFQRFHRVKHQRRIDGIGLGLYITKSLVEAHGGRIWVESEVGKGSTFYVTFPLAATFHQWQSDNDADATMTSGEAVR